ncbi:alpha/beta fold hydrolase [Desulfovibrio sp. OttesenSCG-928-I05]|nr:alpha/beta fold hydrolase [Desulfovibrio sp. OttesenSCG-928-I05]
MTGCLLIHGFCGSSFEMEPLVAPLKNAGCRVRLVTLPGHGSSPEAFMKTSFTDWAAAAEEEYRRLAAEVEQCFVIGLSMGGTLCLHLAARFPVAGAVCLAAPVFIYSYFPWRMPDWRMPFLPLIARHTPRIAKRPSRPESREIAPWEGYEGALYPPQILSLVRGTRAVRQNLSAVTAPLLLIQDAGDRLVYPDNLWTIAKEVRSEDIRMRLTRIREEKTSRHLLTTHRETRAFVADQVAAFVEGLASRG